MNLGKSFNDFGSGDKLETQIQILLNIHNSLIELNSKLDHLLMYIIKEKSLKNDDNKFEDINFTLNQ